MYANICTLFGFILATISVVDGGSYCIYTYTYLYYYNHYCSFGCCGYYSNPYCCSVYGPVIGIIVGILSVIGVIVVITFCCCRRRRANPGMVMQPVSQYPVNPGGVTVMQSTGVMPPGVVYPQAPHTTTVVTGYPNTAYQSPPYVQGIQPQPNTEGFQSQQLMPTSPPPYPGLENELQQK